MSDRVLIIREAVVKITQMLSGKGIRVTQRGVDAYVKSDATGRPILVNLPYLPDNATDELCNAIQGFLDHEVAHILFSDFTLMAKSGNKSVASLLNILEDARIEKAMAKRFSGSGHNLSVTGKFFLNRYTMPKMEEAIAGSDSNMMMAVLMVPLLRAMSGQYIFKEFMVDKMAYVKPVYEKIQDLEQRIEDADSTGACLEIAKEIHKRLEEENEGEGGEGKTPEDKGSGAKKKTETKKKTKPDVDESKSKGSSDESKSEDESEKGSKSKGDKSEENDSECHEQDEEENEEDSREDESKEQEDEGESESEESGEDDSEGDSDDGFMDDTDEKSDEEEEGEGSEGEKSDESDESDTDDETESSSDDDLGGSVRRGDSSMFLDALDKESANGYDELMSRLISDETLKAASNAQYLIYTKDDDKIEPLHVGRGYSQSMFTSLADKVDHMVGPLQKDLERAIAARSLSTWEAGRRSGRLHAANLSRLAAGDDRVFRRKHESTSKDVAVSLVIDASGSMSGSKIHLATQSAYALSQVLERIGIRHEVICFTTGHYSETSGREVFDRLKGKRTGYSRVEPLYMPVIKSFEERMTSGVKERFGWLPNSNILRNNVDGECVEIAARRLKLRREAGKVMIVLSDGLPCAYGNGSDLDKHLTQAVKDITKSGVNVVGIGIMDSSVQRYYPKNLVINDVQELPTRVIKELRHLLVG